MKIENPNLEQVDQWMRRARTFDVAICRSGDEFQSYEEVDHAEATRLMAGWVSEDFSFINGSILQFGTNYHWITFKYAGVSRNREAGQAGTQDRSQLVAGDEQ